MKEWFTIAELVAARLPELPSTAFGLRKFADRNGWDAHQFLCRKNEAGAVEYHYKLLPRDARARVAFDAAPKKDATAEDTRGALLWKRFNLLTEEQRAVCERRLSVLVAAQDMADIGMNTSAILNQVRERYGVAKSSLYEWRQLVSGHARQNWLAALAPSQSSIANGEISEKAECHPEAWKHLCSDYLRAGEPKFSACYRRMKEEAAIAGWSPIPHERTLRRRINAEFPPAAQVLARKGREAARRMVPSQRRDKSGLHALQVVNTDGHVLDLRIIAPWSKEPVRITLLGTQDVYSGKILSWRLCQAETWEAVRSAIGDMVEQFGIPELFFMDNGKAFASKKISGGAKSRNRFKIREDEISGLLTTLGIEAKFTTPYRGQAKPIERAWKDLAQEISLHPSMDGAYTGSNPQAKPHNYGARTVTLEEVQRLTENRVAEHNARTGRNSKIANGRSFDQTFEESYNSHAHLIRRPTADQRSLWLLATHQLTARKPDGRIEYLGNRYWNVALNGWIGKKVTFRFDPDRLHDPIKVYDPQGRLICDAKCIDDAGFTSMADARSRMREEKEFLNASKAYLAARDLLKPSELGALALGKKPERPEPSKAVVTRMATTKASGNALRKVEPDMLSDEEFSEGFSNAMSRISKVISLSDFPAKSRGKR